MTVSKSPRLGLTRWSDDADPWLRSDWDSDNAQLEALAAMAEAGTLALRPASGKAGRFYYDATDDSLYYDTGSKWVTLTRANSDGAVTLGANISSAGDGNTVVRRNGMVSLLVGITNSATLANGATLMTVPAGYRPPRNVPVSLRTGSATQPSQANVATTGVVTLVSGANTFTAGTVFTADVTYPQA